MVALSILTHWDRVTYICVSKLTVIGSDNGLSPDRRQAIIWTNAGLSLIGPLGTSVSEILIKILTFSLKKCVWKYRLRNGGHFVSSRLFTQRFIQTQIKENMKAPCQSVCVCVCVCGGGGGGGLVNSPYKRPAMFSFDDVIVCGSRLLPTNPLL